MPVASKPTESKQFALVRGLLRPAYFRPFCYTRIPGHAIPLTGAGREQAREAGPVIRELLHGERPAVYLSPYLRARETFALLGIEGACERVTQEPRLREQDWGIDLFESLSNPRTCEYRVLESGGGKWRLDRPFAQWRESPDGETQG